MDTDVRHEGSVFLGQLKLRFDCACPLDKEAYAIKRVQELQVRIRRVARHVESRYRVGMFACHAQRLATGCQEPELRTVKQELVRQTRGRFENVLTVVENQQQGFCIEERF